MGIYEDKLSQSGDKILSSHITKNIIKNCFYSLFIQTKVNKQTKRNKTVVKIHESLLFTCWEVKQQIMSISCSTCWFHAHHAIFSSLEGNIAEVSKILTSGN